jgi:hypothetical protein
MSIDTDEIVLILSGVKILQDLDVEVIEDIAEHIEITEFQSGDMVVEKGHMGNRIYFTRAISSAASCSRRAKSSAKFRY